MTEVLRERAMAEILTRLRQATLLIATGTLLGFGLPYLARTASSYTLPAQQWTAFGLLAAVSLVAAVRLVRGRELGWLRWVLLGTVVVARVLAATGTQVGTTESGSGWSYGMTGWYGLLVLLDYGPRATMVFLAGHVAFGVAHAAVVGKDLVGFSVVTLMVTGQQVAFVLGTVILRRLAAHMVRVLRQAEEVRLAETISEHLHEDRKSRYAGLRSTAVPLLADLAAGTNDLRDRRVRDRYAIEATRLRRLFAEHDDVPDPLLHELRACTEVAERRGVTVHLDVFGEHADPPMPVRRALTDAAMRALAVATSRAKVTLIGTEGAVTVSVLADGTVYEHAEDDPAVTVTSMVDGDLVWVEATWRT